MACAPDRMEVTREVAYEPSRSPPANLAASSAKPKCLNVPRARPSGIEGASVRAVSAHVSLVHNDARSPIVMAPAFLKPPELLAISAQCSAASSPQVGQSSIAYKPNGSEYDRHPYTHDPLIGLYGGHSSTATFPRRSPQSIMVGPIGTAAPFRSRIPHHLLRGHFQRTSDRPVRSRHPHRLDRGIDRAHQRRGLRDRRLTSGGAA